MGNFARTTLKLFVPKVLTKLPQSFIIISESELNENSKGECFAMSKEIIKIEKDKNLVKFYVDLSKKPYILNFTDGTIIGLSGRTLTALPQLTLSFDNEHIENRQYYSMLRQLNRIHKEHWQLFLSLAEKMSAVGCLEYVDITNWQLESEENLEELVRAYIKQVWNKKANVSWNCWLQKQKKCKIIKDSHYLVNEETTQFFEEYGISVPLSNIRWKILKDIIETTLIPLSHITYLTIGRIIEKFQENLALLGITLDEKKNHYIKYIDEIGDLAEIERNKENNEKIKETMMKHSKWWEYEDEHFCIKTPTSVKDIKEEGERQRNCVGRLYTQSVVNGNTQIIFIRKKENSEKSYITCEVTPNGNIIQYFLACNRYVETESIEEQFRFGLQAHINKCIKEGE